MDRPHHIGRKPDHFQQKIAVEEDYRQLPSAVPFYKSSAISGTARPRDSAMGSSSLQVQKKTTGTISNAVASGITSVANKPVIVDNGSKPRSGQMTQTAFLAKLDQDIRAVSDPLLKKKGTSTDQCPWLYWAFTYYEYMTSASEIQTALNTYIPSTQGAISATDLINKVCAYVKTHVTVWVNTGKVTGVPKDVMANLSQLKKGGKMVQKKSADGSMQPANGAEQIHQQLEGSGQSLNGSLRTKMESAMGVDLSGVKVHTGGEAGSIASSQNAKALTVGQHIAFGSGQYQPGTMHGDALIAHELAHTIQQKGAEQSVQSKDKNQNSYDALEHDADNTAVSAVSSIWGSTKEWMSGLGKKTGPALKSGLQLQKCTSDYDKAIKEAEDAEALSQWQKAKDAYTAALTAKPGDKKAKDGIARCEDKLDRKIVAGTGWAGSGYEKVYNNLKGNSSTYQNLVSEFTGANANYKLEMSFDPNQTQRGIGVTNAEDVYVTNGVQSNTPIQDRTIRTNFAPKFDTTATGGQTLTLNDLGRALTITHENIHALMSVSHGIAFAVDQKGQHQAMSDPGAGSYREYLIDTLNEFVTKNNFAVTSEQIELISFWGTLGSITEIQNFISVVQAGKITDTVAQEALTLDLLNVTAVQTWVDKINKNSIEPIIYNTTGQPDRFMLP